MIVNNEHNMKSRINEFIKSNLSSEFDYINNIIELNISNFKDFEVIGVLHYFEYPTTLLFLDNENNIFLREWIDVIDNIDYYLWFKLNIVKFNDYIQKNILENEIFDNPIDGLYYIESINSINEQKDIFIVNNLTITNYTSNLSVLFDENDCPNYQKILDKINSVLNKNQLFYFREKPNSYSPNFYKLPRIMSDSLNKVYDSELNNLDFTFKIIGNDHSTYKNYDKRMRQVC